MLPNTEKLVHIYTWEKTIDSFVCTNFDFWWEMYTSGINQCDILRIYITKLRDTSEVDAVTEFFFKSGVCFVMLKRSRCGSFLCIVDLLDIFYYVGNIVLDISGISTKVSYDNTWRSHFCSFDAWINIQSIPLSPHTFVYVYSWKI